MADVRMRTDSGSLRSRKQKVIAEGIHKRALLDKVRQLGRQETQQRLLRSGLHPHPGPGCNFDEAEAFDEPGSERKAVRGTGGTQSATADIRERITAVIDRCQAPLTSRPDLSDEMREFLAEKRAEAIDRKVKIAEAAEAAKTEAAKSHWGQAR